MTMQLPYLPGGERLPFCGHCGLLCYPDGTCPNPGCESNVPTEFVEIARLPKETSVADTVNIAGIDKAELLAAFYNASSPIGMGKLHARSGVMTREMAEQCIADGTDDVGFARRDPLYFDYLMGRPLKIDLSGDEMDPWGFDRDHGHGATARIVASLRTSAAPVMPVKIEAE